MDKFPRDTFELVAVVTALIGITGGLYSLWFLSTQVPS